MIELIMYCPFCGKEHSVMVHETELKRWKEGELAQRAFARLNEVEREQIISGICDSCQEEFFGPDEEDRYTLDDLGLNWW